MPIFQLIRGISALGEEITKREIVEDDMPLLLDINVTASVVKQAHLLPIDVSQLQALAIITDIPGTAPVSGSFMINNNSNGDVIDLVPTLPHLWSIASGLDCPLGEVDVTEIFVTNSDTAETMRLRVWGIFASEPA